MEPQPKYVIFDPYRPAFAVRNPFSGWVFTSLLPYAHRFASPGEAEAVLSSHYKGLDGLLVRPVSK